MIDIEKFAVAFIAVVWSILAIVFSYKIGHHAGYESGYHDALNQPHKPDTVWVTDTITIDRPVEKWHTIEKPVYFAVTDTMLVSIHDTTFVALERSRKGYSGDEYEAVVSGVDPALESIRVFPKTAYITNTIVERRRWSLGVAAGPGVFWDGKFHAGAGIVAGVQFNF